MSNPMKQLHQHLSNNLTWYRQWHQKPQHNVIHYGLLLGVFILLGASLFAPTDVRAVGNTYYVATTGSDSNPGTIGSPFKTVGKLSSVMHAGDIAYVREGTYRSAGNSGGLDLWLQNLHGTAAAPIVVQTYPGETAIFNFDHQTPTATPGTWQCNPIAFVITGSEYIHLKGKMIFTNLKQVPNGCGVSRGIRVISSPNVTIENVEVSYMGGTGITIDASNNFTLINSDMHHNADALTDNGADAFDNADGFSSTGGDTSTNTTLIGNRFWMNADDGVDFIGTNGVRTLIGNWAFWNGYYQPTPSSPRISAGNGDGIKIGNTVIGGTSMTTTKIKFLYNNVAFENLSHGFDQNGTPTSLYQMYNNTAYKNGGWGFQFQYYEVSPGEAQTFRNNISFSNTSGALKYIAPNTYNTNNTWSSGFTVSAADFQSVSSVGVDGPRQADGSLPDLPFLKLKSTSGLVDRGMVINASTPNNANAVVIPYNGTAPDLGAYETGSTSSADLVAPTVSLTSPANGALVSGTIPVTMAANATDNVAVAKVDFYRGSTLIGSDVDSPYSVAWNTSVGGNGSAVLTAVATDTSGNSATSAAVTVTVSNSTPANVAPTANAGADKSITLPTNSVTLAGSGTDTDGTIASYAWTRISGSGTIAAPTAASTSITGLAQGTSVFRLTVTDNQGATATDDVNVVVNAGADTTAPTFLDAISVGGTSGTFWFFVGASDNVAMSKVDFYVDGTLIGSDNTTTPYGYQWDSTTVANGSHAVTAKAYDTAGNVATSGAVSFTLTNPDITAPATAVITAPAANAVLTNTATITATATDNVGIDHVDFYRGTTLIAGDTAAPYSVQWDTTNVANGSYSLTAKAYDAAGNSKTSAAVAVSVNNVVVPPPDTTAPTVSITTPANGATVSGSVTLGATASDTESGIAKVSFYRGGTTLIDTDTTGTPGYAVVWDTTAVANGTYTLTAKATDGATTPNTGTSAAITVTVANDLTAPVVSLTAPATAGQTISGVYTLKATATDNVAMAKVEFYRGGTTLIGIQTSGPGSSFDLPWDTTGLSGSYSITAKAYDTNGNSTTTAARSVTIVVPDTTAPTVSITNPASSYIKAGTRVTIKASASDTVGVSKVEFYVNDVLKCTDTSSAYTCTWSMPTAVTGYNLTAKAYDAAGNVATSNTVKLTNKSTSATGTFTFSPLVLLRNSGGILNVQSAVTSINTITKVEFYLGSTLIGTDATRSPYDIGGGAGWNSTSVANGTYSVTAKAYDNQGNVATSSPLSVKISN